MIKAIRPRLHIAAGICQFVAPYGLIVLLFFATSAARGQTIEIPLGPGEVLLSVNGVPVVPVDPYITPAAVTERQRSSLLGIAAQHAPAFVVPRSSRRWRIRINPVIQAEALREARLMAARNIRGHVGRTLGRFEGCGWSSGSPEPPTCTPRRGMTLVADAIARGPRGWYRVRAWE